jgi:uroporphyrinogen-III decarboxylase
MGLNFTMEAGKGPVCLNPLSHPSDIDRLIVPISNHESLLANYNAIFLTRLALNGSHTLFGFAGTAWTLMTYIVRDYKYESKVNLEVKLLK